MASSVALHCRWVTWPANLGPHHHTCNRPCLTAARSTQHGTGPWQQGLKPPTWPDLQSPAKQATCTPMTRDLHSRSRPQCSLAARRCCPALQPGTAALHCASILISTYQPADPARALDLQSPAVPSRTTVQSVPPPHTSARVPEHALDALWVRCEAHGLVEVNHLGVRKQRDVADVAPQY